MVLSYNLKLKDTPFIQSHQLSFLSIPEISFTASQLNREAYRKEKEQEFGIETVSESIQKVFIADFGAISQRAKSSENGSNGDQPPKPVKAILKVEKNRDGKTGKTNLYFDYPRSRIITNDEYMDEFGGVMRF